jgi:hypothetical protein
MRSGERAPGPRPPGSERPFGRYDPQLIRDFHHSGAHDPATYAVGSRRDSAVSLLVVIPLVCLSLGSLAGRITAYHDG